MKLQSGHEVVRLEGSEKKKQAEDFKGYYDGLIRLTPGRWLFPTRFRELADQIYNFKFKSSDVVIMTWPKCGTTWTQEIVWTMRNNADLNHPDAASPPFTRVPFVEMDMLLSPNLVDLPAFSSYAKALQKKCPKGDPVRGLNFDLAQTTPDPRTIKTHLPFSLMSPSLLDTTKVIYVARNPKDVIISYHHHCRILKVQSFVGSFEDFVQYFVDGDLVYGPYWLHVKEAWEKRSHPNLHFCFFEDMKANPLEEIKKLDTFLQTNLSEKQMENITKYTSFSQMKARSEEGDVKEPCNEDISTKDGGFFRKGESGDWKGKFTPELDAKVNQWTKENMSSFGVNFKYEI